LFYSSFTEQALGLIERELISESMVARAVVYRPSGMMLLHHEL
jgi:hypothetical protein